MTPQPMEDFSDDPVQYPVSIWEGIAILGGAILLIAAGLAGLGVKALGNAFDSQRAEAIAQSLMDYDIPGGSKGFFGTNIGGGKMAVITSNEMVPLEAQQTPAIELFTARMPLNRETDTEAKSLPTPQPRNELFSGFSFSYQDPAAFQITQAQTEQKPFCGALTPVEVQQGALTIAGGAVPVSAVKYEVKRVLDDESHIVVISALGDQAAQQAAAVFESLQCE
ncbi:MAG: hypothetical protein HC827_14310 [Cyanobacteria bacterium RM1_2_2]|nr:hypothetical protein [Cyanobacteria bacterium RM1_2_2]